MRTKYKMVLLTLALVAIAVLFINRGRAYSLFFGDEMPERVDTAPKPLELPADPEKSTPPAVVPPVAVPSQVPSPAPSQAP